MNNLDSVYEVQLAQLAKLGGDADPRKYASVYDVNLAILDKIGQGGGGGLEPVVVDVLPSVGETGKMYFVPNAGGEKDNYKEFVWVNGAWECVGNADVDLKDYALKTWVESKGYATETWTTEKGNEIMGWVESQGYLTEHQTLKTINGESIVGEGNIKIEGGGGSGAVSYTGLHFTSANDFTIMLKHNGSSSKLNLDLDYSFDGENWSKYTVGTTVNVSGGSTICFRGDNAKIGSIIGSTYMFMIDEYHTFVITGTDVYADGILESLMSRTSYEDERGVPEGNYYQLFRNCSCLKSAPKTKCVGGGRLSFQSMYSSCASLEKMMYLHMANDTVPASSYIEMYYGCNSLTEGYIYEKKVDRYGAQGMFGGCQSITKITTYFSNADVDAISNAFGVGPANGTFYDLGDNNNFSKARIPSDWVIKKALDNTIKDSIVADYATYSSSKIDTDFAKKEDLSTYAKVVSLTQAEYDALDPKDPMTIYIISDAE